MTRARLRGLTLHYPGADRPAVDALDLDLAPGGITALLGPSGCGKTSTMKMLAGLLRPTAGSIAFDGEDQTGRPPERRRAVMVFQNHLVFPHMSVAENVGFGLRMRGLDRREIARRVDAMLDRVRLTGFGRRRPAELSGGQSQRVALARALITEPRLLLLDEPLSNLDAHLRAEMRELIAGLQRQSGVTTLLVTHDREEAVILADKLALMLDGAIRQVGPPEAFFARPVDEDVARFFGAGCLLAGEVRGGRFHGALGTLDVAAGVAEGPGRLVLRPESVCLGAGAQNTRQAHVVGRDFLGTSVRLSLAIGETTIAAQIPAPAASSIAVGSDIVLHLPADALWVIP